MEPMATMLVTGASGGIGEATARLAAAAGMNVVLAARRVDLLDELAAELGGSGRALAVGCDVTSYADCEAAVDRALDAFGRLDAVVANAGFGSTGPGWSHPPLSEWRTQVDVNVLGPAHTSRAALPALTASRGHLVLIGSIAGRRPHAGSMYACTKHAVAAMGEALRLELTGTGVRVCVVNPGLTDTAMAGPAPPDWAMRPRDVAHAVMFAISQPPHVDVNEIVIRGTGQDV